MMMKEEEKEKEEEKKKNIQQNFFVHNIFSKSDQKYTVPNLRGEKKKGGSNCGKEESKSLFNVFIGPQIHPRNGINLVKGKAKLWIFTGVVKYVQASSKYLKKDNSRRQTAFAAGACSLV